ncbi:GreA/GreB family elongation factor [Marinobacterium rhizophilum]|uniref:GreA/GreB family elongation factor n=1 Tax=Marinobacterium rhizophilum TaxID=420402 RepID=A0ABY5HFR0_9GAMM|nr:GreA/GreB family elongation factor [Marinobacterium rhizophilum]UTW11191.1 GreA/GreB family elongation factor [Marinobacterium rhizophilum]
MSRAFVKEDSDQPEHLPDRPLSPHPNYMTPEGHRRMQAQLKQCEQEISALKAGADWAASSRLPPLERDLRYLRARLKSAQVIDAAALDASRVRFGCTVHFVDEQGTQHRFRIVGEDEADIAQGLLSWTSPLASALLGQEPGDSVRWQRPAGELEIEITAID